MQRGWHGGQGTVCAPPLPGSLGKAEAPEVASESRHNGLALPTPGLPSFLLLPPWHSGSGGTVGPHPFSEPSLKTTGELALPVREQKWQQVKASPYGLGIPLPSLLPTEGWAVLKDSFGLPTHLRPARALQGPGSGRWGAYRGASPPALLLRAAVSQGQSAQKSESQQVVATPTPMPNYKQNRGNEKMGWGKDKPKQNPLTSCPGWRVQPVAGAGDPG